MGGMLFPRIGGANGVAGLGADGKLPLAHTRGIPATAITVTTDDFVLDHAGANVILLTVGGTGTRSSHANAWLTAGAYDGHTVRVFVVALTATILRLRDGKQSSQVDLMGDMNVCTPWCYIDLIWDGAQWHELRRSLGDRERAAPGLFATALGRTCVATGMDGMSWGYGAKNDSEDGTAFGYGPKIDQRCAVGYANGYDSVRGDAQLEWLTLKASTTDDTPTPLGGPRNERWKCKFNTSSIDNRVFGFVVRVTGVQQGGSNAFMAQLTGLVWRTGDTVSLLAAGSDAATGNWTLATAGASTWSAVLAVSGTDVLVNVTGAADTNIKWIGELRALERQYAL